MHAHVCIEKATKIATLKEANPRMKTMRINEIQKNEWSGGPKLEDVPSIAVYIQETNGSLS